jgi:hypothetical protein
MAGGVVELIKFNKLSNKFMLLLGILMVLIIIRIILTKELGNIILMTFCLLTTTVILSNNLYININGIYKNGIIFNEYIKWDRIHSYKWLDDETISFLKKEGSRIDFNKIKNKDKIIETIRENNILENNN